MFDTVSTPHKSDMLKHSLVWNKVQMDMYKLIGRDLYENWIKNVAFCSCECGDVVLSVKTQFAKDWISVNFLDKIFENWKKYDQCVCSISIIVDSKEENKQSKDESSYQHDTSNQQNDDIITSTLDRRFTFENFVVGKPNELAFSAAKRVAESNTPVHGSNPLFLYGGVGLGKTHLMHAIAWYITNCSTHVRKFAYLSAEKFMYQYITALRSKDIMMFKEQFRSVDVLMVDDVQFISGKDSTQEEFFHTFNALIDQNKQLVISADRSPSDLDGVEERIKSRLGWGLVADLNDTTFELRLGILHSKVENAKVPVPEDVLKFLAQNIKSNVRELEGALHKVLASASLYGNSITVESARNILVDLLRSNQKAISIEDIQKKTADYFGIRVQDILSSRRSRSVARPRQIAMYLSKVMTSKSLPDIGRTFGGRDHATVINAVKQIEKLKLSDYSIDESIKEIIKFLK